MCVVSSPQKRLEMGDFVGVAKEMIAGTWKQ
jgi:hypothetical protein